MLKAREEAESTSCVHSRAVLILCNNSVRCGALRLFQSVLSLARGVTKAGRQKSFCVDVLPDSKLALTLHQMLTNFVFVSPQIHIARSHTRPSIGTVSSLSFNPCSGSLHLHVEDNEGFLTVWPRNSDSSGTMIPRRLEFIFRCPHEDSFCFYHFDRASEASTDAPETD